MTSETQTATTGFPLVIPTKTQVPTARLLLRNDMGQVVQQWLIRQNKCTLGSSASCTLRCNAPGVAPYHALLVVGARQIFVRALAPKLTRDGQPVNEILLTDENSHFEIAGQTFELTRGAKVEGDDPPKTVNAGRLKFTLARPFALNNRKERSKQETTSPQQSAEPTEPNTKWIAQLIQSAIEPLECQLQNVLEPLAELQVESRIQRELREQFPSDPDDAPGLDDVSETNTQFPAQLEELAAKQSAAMDVIGERIQDVNQQLTAIERIVVEDREANVSASTGVADPTHTSAIEQLQSGIISVSSALRDLESRQQAKRDEDQTWQSEIQFQIASLSETILAVPTLPQHDDQSRELPEEILTWKTEFQNQFAELHHAIEHIAANTVVSEEIVASEETAAPQAEVPLAELPPTPLVATDSHEEFFFVDSTDSTETTAVSVEHTDALDSDIAFRDVCEPSVIEQPDTTVEVVPPVELFESLDAQQHTDHGFAMDQSDVDAVVVQNELRGVAPEPGQVEEDVFFGGEFTSEDTLPSRIENELGDVVPEPVQVEEDVFFGGEYTSEDTLPSRIEIAPNDSESPNAFLDVGEGSELATPVADDVQLDRPDSAEMDLVASDPTQDQVSVQEELVTFNAPEIEEAAVPVDEISEQGTDRESPQELGETEDDLPSWWTEEQAAAQSQSSETPPAAGEQGIQPDPNPSVGYEEPSSEEEVDLPDPNPAAGHEEPSAVEEESVQPDPNSAVAFEELSAEEEVVLPDPNPAAGFEEPSAEEEVVLPDPNSAVSLEEPSAEEESFFGFGCEEEPAEPASELPSEAVQEIDIMATSGEHVRSEEVSQDSFGSVIELPQATVFESEHVVVEAEKEAESEVELAATIDTAPDSAAEVAQEGEFPGMTDLQPTSPDARADETNAVETVSDEHANGLELNAQQGKQSSEGESQSVEDIAATDEEPVGDEASVEDYMRKLLARMRGVPEDEVEMPQAPVVSPPQPALVVAQSVPAAVTAVPTEDVSVSKPETVQQDPGNQPTTPFDPESYVPRVAIPEKAKDLAAMRELANSSARTAIHKSTRKRHMTSAMLKLTIAVVGLVVGSVLVAINGFNLNIGLIATVAAFLVAGIWGYDAISSLKPLLHSGLVLKPVIAADDSDTAEAGTDQAQDSR